MCWFPGQTLVWVSAVLGLPEVSNSSTLMGRQTSWCLRSLWRPSGRTFLAWRFSVSFTSRQFSCFGGGRLAVEVLRSAVDTYWTYSIWAGKLCRQKEISLHGGSLWQWKGIFIPSREACLIYVIARGRNKIESCRSLRFCWQRIPSMSCSYRKHAWTKREESESGLRNEIQEIEYTSY